MSGESQGKKVVVVGAGWAGLGATYQLAKQGYDVTLLEAGSYPGGLVAGWQTSGGRSVEAGIHGFWYPYRNIFFQPKRKFNLQNLRNNSHPCSLGCIIK